MKTYLYRFLMLSAAVSLVGAALAQSQLTPTELPSGVAVRNVHATLGADGIARIDSGNDVGIQQVPALPVYSNIDTAHSSGYYFPSGEEWEDIIPIPAPALIDEMTFWYYDGVGLPDDTGDVDFIFYGNLNDNGEIYEEGCGAGNRDVAFNAITIVGIPLDNGFSWLVTVSGLAMVVPGGFYIGHLYYNQSHGDPAATGSILMDGDNVGVPLGYYSSFNYSNYPFNSSGGDSQNCMCRLSDGGSYWFGGFPPANFAYEFAGRYSYVGELTGDYGTSGGLIGAPNPTIWVMISNGVEDPIAELTVNYGGFFHLPFMDFGPYDIQFMNQYGYLSHTDVGAAPDPVGFTTVGTFPLTAGDANYDNTVNLLDINTSLTNFGLSGS